MTASSDNFINAFAIYLQASAAQMGVLTALPQFFGALMQILSIWLGQVIPRRKLVYNVAIIQCCGVAVLALLALPVIGDSVKASKVPWLIGLVVLYHSCLNLIQPQWRAWMGDIVPRRRRGAFFAARTRLSMVASLAVFLGGGALLTGFDKLGAIGIGFAVLFAIASTGRAASSYYLWRMHDPSDRKYLRSRPGTVAPVGRFGSLRDYLSDRNFLHYTLFIAGMQGVVAISAPFFAVYMLKVLELSYLQFALNSVASVATQFALLGFWGRFSDRHGNRLVMLITSCLLPLLPILWLFSPDYSYLLLVQVISGFAWSGFTLSTANFLYDIRPHKTNFAAYAAVQQAVGASAVFCGALFGGFCVTYADTIMAVMPAELRLEHGVFLVFVISGVLRAGIALWFIPRCKEPRIRKRPEMLQIVFRVARFNPISGVVLDWLTVTRKRKLEEERD
ncbi:MFS transporter [Allohahella marinimesophila]|uniref:MFS transporter n=2 Tax=Allohahella marinimesophila TaxID=1054972 RepID=A0ABP7PFL5_9GAMM